MQTKEAHKMRTRNAVLAIGLGLLLLAPAATAGGIQRIDLVVVGMT